jgi:hypothetical protein
MAATIASTPVTRKLGMTVSAGSQPCHADAGSQGGPIALITSPLGATLPCCVSK